MNTLRPGSLFGCFCLVYMFLSCSSFSGEKADEYDYFGINSGVRLLISKVSVDNQQCLLTVAMENMTEKAINYTDGMPEAYYEIILWSGEGKIIKHVKRIPRNEGALDGFGKNRRLPGELQPKQRKNIIVYDATQILSTKRNIDLIIQVVRPTPEIRTVLVSPPVLIPKNLNMNLELFLENVSNFPQDDRALIDMHKDENNDAADNKTRGDMTINSTPKQVGMKDDWTNGENLALNTEIIIKENEIRMKAIYLAVKMYEADHGRLPVSLTELTKNYLIGNSPLQHPSRPISKERHIDYNLAPATTKPSTHISPKTILLWDKPRGVQSGGMIVFYSGETRYVNAEPGIWEKISGALLGHKNKELIKKYIPDADIGGTR